MLGRRLVVIDPGREFIKVLVVDHGLFQPRVVHFETIVPSEAPGAVVEDMEAELDRLLAQTGAHERVLVLPQYRAIAQVVEAPSDTPAEIRAALIREARRLSGLDEGGMAFDAQQLRPFGRYQRPSWLTLCKREELDSLLGRFATTRSEAGAPVEDIVLAEVTTSGQALFAAAHALGPEARSAVLVDLRAHNSVIAIVIDGQGVQTTTIPTGSIQFHTPGASGPSDPGRRTDDPAFKVSHTNVEAAAAALRKWGGEIRLAVSEWLEDNPECRLALSDLPVFLCGVGATQPGLIEFLNTLGPLRFVAWEHRVTSGRPWPMADYLVPYGAALLAFQRAPHGASFLPAEDRSVKHRRRTLARLQSSNVLLMVLLVALLGFAIHQKRDLVQRKREITARAQASLQSALAIDQAYRELNQHYAEVLPILERQRSTMEALQTLAAVRSARTNDDFWYVLFADATSYATGRTGVAVESPPGDPPPAANPTSASASREFVVEVCTPHDGERQRRILSDLVSTLKREVIFRRVDALPPERKRDWLATNVYVSNHVFAIAMEVAGNELPPVSSLAPAAPETTRDNRRPGTARNPAPAEPPRR